MRVVSEVVGMPDIFSIITHGKMRQNAIDSQKEFEAKKGKSGGLVSSPEAEELLKKYPSKAIRLPVNHLDFKTEHNSTLRDFVVEHKEAGIRAVIKHVLDNGTDLHKDNKEKITDFFADDYKKKISHSATVTDFYSCFTDSSVGTVVRKHLSEVPAEDPKRTILGAVVSHPEAYVDAVRKMINFYPHLRGLIPETPKK